MPRGIYGRAALILLLPVVFLQLVVTVIFAQRHFEGVTHQMTDTVLRELTLVMQIVNDAPTAPLAEQAVQAQLAPLRITALAVDVSTPENKRVLPLIFFLIVIK